MRPRAGDRRQALVHLLDRRLRGHLAAQAAKALSVLIALGYAALVVGVSVSGAESEVGHVVTSALRWLTWIGAGGVALAATGPGRSADDDGVLDLAAQRGFSQREIALARSLSVARRALRVAGLPAVAVALVAVATSGSLALLPQRALLLAGVCAYCFVLAGVCALTVALCRAVSRERARWLLVLVVVLPHAARSLWSHVPSIPALFANLLSGLASFGWAT